MYKSLDWIPRKRFDLYGTTASSTDFKITRVMKYAPPVRARLQQRLETTLANEKLAEKFVTTDWNPSAAIFYLRL